MPKVFRTSTFKVVTLPLLGVLGTLLAITYPAGHAAFCTGLSQTLV